MKVLLLANYPEAHPRATKWTFIRKRAEALARYAEVVVVSPRPWRFDRALPERRGERILVLRPAYPPLPGRTFLPLKGVLYFLATFPTVRRAVREGAEVIHAHYSYPHGFAAVLLGRALGRPVCVTAHGSDINLLIDRRLLRPQLRWALARAGAVITVSEVLRERVLSLGVDPGRVIVLRNGYDTESFRPRDRGETRERLGVDLNEKVVLCVSNLVPIKAPDNLVGALSLLPGEAPLCVFIGDGPMREALQAQVARLGLSGRVRFLGARPNEEVALWMSAADLLCLPSRSEGLPTVVAEALACGLPVVATDVGGTHEVVIHGRTGLLVPPDDPQALAEALGRLLGDEGLRRRMSEAALEELPRLVPSWDEHARREMEVYRSLAAASGALGEIPEEHGG